MRNVPESSKTLVVDVDGTVCASREYEYKDAEPITWAREYLNKLHQEGWYIVYFTARYYRRNHRDLGDIYAEGYEELKTWLDTQGFVYDEIRLGKPSGEYYLDNRAWRIDNFGPDPAKDWEALLKHMKENERA